MKTALAEHIEAGSRAAHLQSTYTRSQSRLRKAAALEITA
jgi:hypothetical protein